MIKKIVEYSLQNENSLSATILRIPVGIALMAHGAQKLFGWFGGYGLEATGQWMSQGVFIGQWLSGIGIEAGFLLAFLAGSAEFFGGLALVLGLLTRPAGLVNAFTMLVAMTVHLGSGFFAAKGGYEYALVLFAASLALAIQGGGRYALDNLVRDKVLKLLP